MTILCRRSTVVALGALVAVVLAAPQEAQGQRTLVFKAEDAFESGLGAWNVQRNYGGQGLVLFNHLLVEDDGAGIGSDSKWLNEAQKSPVIEVGGAVKLKKVLRVEDPQATVARLYLEAGLQVEINGSPVQTNPKAEYPEVPAGLLKKGDNEIVVSMSGEEKRSVKVARREDTLKNDPSRKDRPQRSFLSDDGGKTWKPVDGEVMIRLHLVQHRKEGSFISPVVDLRTSAAGGLLPDVMASSVTLKAEGETPGGTSVELMVREGSSPVYDEKLWGPWKPAAAAVAVAERYVQWQAVLKTSRALETPVLKSVRLEIADKPQAAPPWASTLKVGERKNPEIFYTSIPFAYEDYKEPRLAALREKYKLDEVVSAGKTEFEKMVILRNWVSGQWKYDPPGEYYPKWDADDIMTHKIGFCVQYAVTYMQCCLAMGWQARFVFGYQPGIGSGHEVNEVWSNQYGKWVFMDANGNRHHVDPATGEPLSIVEVHDRMVKAFYPGVAGMIETGLRSKTPVAAKDIGTCRKLEMAAPPVSDTPPKSWPAYNRWLYLHMVPRNNFYGQQYPVPLIQGWNWDWTGYWTWNDGRLETRWKYDKITGRKADYYWTLNEVRYGLDFADRGDKPNTLAVQMGTVTPGLETFLVSTDRGETWKPSGSTYAWGLAAGKNRLEMRVRNTAGVPGPVSFVEVER